MFRLSWTFWSQNYWDHEQLPQGKFFIDEIQNGRHITFKKYTFGHIFVHHWHKNLILMLKYMFWGSSNPKKYISLRLRHEMVFSFILIRFLLTKVLNYWCLHCLFRQKIELISKILRGNPEKHCQIIKVVQCLKQLLISCYMIK